MNLEEALKALKEGKRIRRKAWESKETYEIKEGKSLLSEGKWKNCLVLTYSDILADDWEAIDRESILSKKEKECLENFLSLYPDNYGFVFERELIHKQYFLKIGIFPWKSGEKDEYIYMPLSPISENMFSKLEEHHLYTADDLGLFRE